MTTLTLDQAQARVAGLVTQQEALQAQIAAFQDIDNPDALATLQGRLLATKDLISKAREQERAAMLLELGDSIEAVELQHAALIEAEEAAHGAVVAANNEARRILTEAQEHYNAVREQRMAALARLRELRTDRERLTI